MKAHRNLSLASIHDEVKREDLEAILQHAEEEARMVLPGVQALFGFQLIAVFNAGFKVALTHAEQLVHLLALGSVALSITLILCPVAYHRQAEPSGISSDFVRMATQLITLGLLPLVVGTSLDFYLICRIILGRTLLSLILGVCLFLLMSGCWFVFPQYQRARCRAEEKLR